MSHERVRACPLCDGAPSRQAFPYETVFDAQSFRYYACENCRTVFVSPVPSAATFARMYDQHTYHDTHYAQDDAAAATHSLRWVQRDIPAGARLLDYGCGSGAFMQAAAAAGYDVSGVEFAASTVARTQKKTQRSVFLESHFSATQPQPLYDAIRMGDVFEHLADPLSVCQMLCSHLKPGGSLIIEGPLQAHPSLVYASARAFKHLRRFARTDAPGRAAPTHLILTNKSAQLRFTEQRLHLRTQRVHTEETGWPYTYPGAPAGIKRAIGETAIWLARQPLGRRVLANRIYLTATKPVTATKAAT